LRGVQAGTEIEFGDLLRRHRAAAGVTQEDLAGHTGLTPQAIGLLERGKRRHPHAYTVQKLAEALELEGRDLSEFEAAAKRSTTPPSRNHTPVYEVPTPPTSLVGREHEVATLSTLLRAEDVRLLTLIGPGGVGKTRLAIEVARRSQEVFADGVVFVPLAPLRDPELVPSVLAETLGVKDVADRSLLDALKRYLQGKQMLLLVDNTEHLLPAAPVVADLVAGCPQLTVLATSRAPLRLSAEQQFPVAPLPIDEAEDPARSPAVRLYLERARAVAPAFELTDANAATVARICERLDGLPLAIELAAARVKLFNPEALLERLDRRLHMLSGGPRDLPERQQTLRDTVAWSHDLLREDEKTLFRRLAVFAGGFTLEAAEVVCGSDLNGEVLETLASLVDNSLLVTWTETSSGPEETRLTMLETIREYAAELLRSSSEAGEVERAHALYYLALAEASQPEESPRIFDQWLAILNRDHDNFRAAMRWAIRHREVDIAARLGLMLWRFWSENFYLGQGRRWLEEVLDLGEPGGGVELPTPSARRWAFLHLVAGIMANGQGDYDRAVTLCEESLALYERMGHRKGTSGPLRELGVVAYHRGDYGRAVHLSERALEVAREFGSTFGAGLATCSLADALRAQGDLEKARTLLEESLSLLRRRPYPLRVANALANTLARLGSIECELGRDTRAFEMYRESLQLGRKFGFIHHVIGPLEGMARVSVVRGRPELAARLLGTSAALRDEMGVPLTLVERADHEYSVNMARTKLGVEAFEVARALGYATPLEEVIVSTVGEER
jgi:predicted ATPase/DNA-binding XRE family transcriptional regulator